MDKVLINLSNIKAAVFDMDGTMINNMPFHKRAWREFFARHGISFSEKEFLNKISLKNDQILRSIFNGPLSDDEVKALMDEKEAIYRELYAPEIKEIKGLSHVIQLLLKRHIHMALATNAIKENRDFVLHALGLEGKFEVIVGYEHISKGKPNPEIYLETAKMLGIAPENCLVFEDSPPGVEAGKQARMTVAGILSMHSREELDKADYLINDYSQISFE